MNRRKFIRNTALLFGGAALVPGCQGEVRQKTRGRIAGANSAAGHLMRGAQWQDSNDRLETGTLIIGGGISGLSAARWLSKNNDNDFLLLELDNMVGGNAASGQNDISAYPWGAHYIPLPNNNCKEYLAFLSEHDVITGYDEKGLPVINEYYLCFEPQERLYINGHWQEGLIPDFGLADTDRKQARAFLQQMQEFRNAKGSDGKDAFAIPVDRSSADSIYKQLDLITMKAWLETNQYHSPYLHWYVNYCCRDDFGTAYDRVSAWAGIHYFAGRKGVAANAPAQSVITWPEGNGWLVTKMRMSLADNIRVNTVATSLRYTAAGVEVCTVNAITKKVTVVAAKQCILAIPQFAAAQLLGYTQDKKELVQQHFLHYPWMVANLTIDQLSERQGSAMCWDNVVYNAKGLGYVKATHQRIGRTTGTKSVITYYCPLTENNSGEERKAAYGRTFDDWIRIIKSDLDNPHGNFDKAVINADVWIWGHGMISPQPGFIHGEIKKQMAAPIDDKVYFAHTDLCGISIFEEAFYQGIGAAEAILKKQQV